MIYHLTSKGQTIPRLERDNSIDHIVKNNSNDAICYQN